DIEVVAVEEHAGADQHEDAAMERRDRQAIEPRAGIDDAGCHDVSPRTADHGTAVPIRGRAVSSDPGGGRGGRPRWQDVTGGAPDQRQFFATGLVRARYLLFCNCYVYSVLDTIDADEGTYRRTHDGAPSPKFIETSRALVAACIQEARARPLE